VISPASGESLLLEEEILSLIERKACGLVWLSGGPGAGKTTALAHLAAVLPPAANVLCLDQDWQSVGPDRLVVAGGIPNFKPKSTFATFELAAWTEDELIEYLLATHRAACESVLRRCRAAADGDRLRGNPDLWRPVLDALAADERLVTIGDALRRVIDQRFSPARVRELASDWSLAILLLDAELNKRTRCQLEETGDFQRLYPLLRHVPVLLMLAAGQIARDLRSGGTCRFLPKRHAAELVSEVGALIKDDGAALGRLKEILADMTCERLQPIAASLMHAAGIGWRPERLVAPGVRNWLRRQKRGFPFLRDAHLQHCRWNRVVLTGLDLSKSDLSDSDLSEAILDDVELSDANLRGSTLRGASLVRVRAEETNLAGANLSYARADQAEFQRVNARSATFEGALLSRASFQGARLGGAIFARAQLRSACFLDADIDGADFSQADLSEACLKGLPLKLAEFRQCSFRKALLDGCDLEGTSLPGADFAGACLSGALLTDTTMPDADFQGADLSNTGLAGIDWERANLYNADLWGASFHMGSSRSGLVDSPIASFGTRTGFYTDDYNEQDFKSPEEIRKANLRGCDLRGAKIEGVDFYLVDLRDARYDSRQEQHFRGCGAILETRAT